MITSGYAQIIGSQPAEDAPEPPAAPTVDPTRHSARVRATDAEKAESIATAAACLERSLCAAGLCAVDLLRLRGEIERAALRTLAFEVIR